MIYPIQPNYIMNIKSSSPVGLPYQAKKKKNVRNKNLTRWQTTILYSLNKAAMILRKTRTRITHQRLNVYEKEYHICNNFLIAL